MSAESGYQPAEVSPVIVEEKPIKKRWASFRRFWRRGLRGGESAIGQNPESEQASVSLEQECNDAIARAIESQEWVTIASSEAMPVPDGHMRLYRAVKPRGIDREFSSLTEEESARFDALMLAGSNGEISTTEDALFLESLSRQSIVTNGEKFFTDDLEVARMTYSDGGAIYMIDLPEDVAWAHKRWNGKLESAAAIPRAMVTNARPYAVGPNIEPDASLKFGTETVGGDEVLSDAKKKEIQAIRLLRDSGYVGGTVKEEEFSVVDNVITQVGISQIGLFESQLETKIKAASEPDLPLENRSEVFRLGHLLDAVKARQLGFTGRVISGSALVRVDATAHAGVNDQGSPSPD
ncbi:MAG: hypothetical protein COY80_01795 [Candidatus Pacebacteria bacterium CG_4_10_14_0_8_um_filter_42_14]|nr:MAG: hypothetical protein COY80_01795 [Candidatus Pacebacteria bacterium CG_4_10_14_0_8_um_filter_42_14]